MDPYEEYMRSRRPDLYPQAKPEAPADNRLGNTMNGAAQGAAAGTAILPGWGTAIGAVVGGGASLYASGKALDSARQENREARQREAMNDYLAQQDRTERRRRTGRNEMLESADYSGDFLDNLMNMYRSYNGGYFNTHGA